MKCASSEFLASIVSCINISLRRFSSEFPPRGGKLIHSPIISHRMQSKLKILNLRITVLFRGFFSLFCLCQCILVWPNSRWTTGPVKPNEGAVRSLQYQEHKPVWRECIVKRNAIVICTFKIDCSTMTILKSTALLQLLTCVSNNEGRR